MSLSITAVIPTYNRAVSLPRAIESIIKQSHAVDEILIIDDGSSDSTEQVCAGFGNNLRYIRHSTNKGASAARNTGIREASKEWIAFLDSDDYWLEDKLVKQMRFMHDHNLNVSCTNFSLIGADGGERGQSLEKDEILTRSNFLWGCFVCPGSTMIARKDLFAKYGYFDESLRRLEDWDWFLRITENEQVGNLQDVLSVVNNTGFPKERDVIGSLQLIRQRYIESGAFTSREKRHVKAGMAMESAKMAWIKKNYPQMLYYLLKSLCHAPRGNRAFHFVAARKLGQAS